MDDLIGKVMATTMEHLRDTEIENKALNRVLCYLMLKTGTHSVSFTREEFKTLLETPVNGKTHEGLHLENDGKRMSCTMAWEEDSREEAVKSFQDILEYAKKKSRR